MSVNQYIRPITAKNNDGILEIGGCSTVKLAEKYGTPLYVVDEATLRGVCRDYQEGFKDYHNIKMMYASKALCTLAIAKIVEEEGFGFDVVSAGEIHTVYKAGVNMENVLFNGSNKTKKEIEFAIQHNVGRYSVDNFHELELLDATAKENNITAEILLRITPGIECHTHEYIQTGQIDSKFGFDMTQIDEAIGLITSKYKNLHLRGLHAHIGSQIFELQSFYDEVEILVKEIARINSKHEVYLDEMNIGGGLGVQYVDTDKAPNIKDLANVVTEAMHKYSVDIPTIYLEPGRSVISTSGVTLYTVGSSKQVPNGRKYVAVDGGMADNIRPSMYQAEYTADVANKMNSKNMETITLAGRYCESADILINEITLPKTNPGDIICVYNTGAYNYSMSSNYNRVEKPAMVLVNNSQSDMIVNRESLDDLISKDIIPDRLRK